MPEKKVRTPEERAKLERMMREDRVREYPSQLDGMGIVKHCLECDLPLNPLGNPIYDATVKEFCNKLCDKDYSKK